MVRHTDAADAGVNTDVQRNGLLRFGRDFIQRGAHRRVNHGHDAASDGILEVLLVERAEEKDGLSNASIAQRDGFVELHDGEAEDFRLRFEELGDVGYSRAVAVVLDDCEDGTRGGSTANFLDIVAQVFAVNFYPGIEGGIFRSGRYRCIRGGGERRRSAEEDREGETGFDKGSPRGLPSEATS